MNDMFLLKKPDLEKFLKAFVMLTDTESEAIKAFYSGGALTTEILFPDSKIQSKVKIAPSLLWKSKIFKVIGHSL
jgi:hypothetical protein